LDDFHVCSISCSTCSSVPAACDRSGTAAAGRSRSCSGEPLGDARLLHARPKRSRFACAFRTDKVHDCKQVHAICAFCAFAAPHACCPRMRAPRPQSTRYTSASYRQPKVAQKGKGFAWLLLCVVVQGTSQATRSPTQQLRWSAAKGHSIYLSFSAAASRARFLRSPSRLAFILSTRSFSYARCFCTRA
jgi:hypothetical protein